MKTARATTKLRACTLFLLLAAVASVNAQEKTPDYSGDFLTRDTMTGDWGGYRSELAEKGITFDLSQTQSEMGVVSGGLRSNGSFSGRFDGYLNVDTGKAGLWKGGFLLVEGEANYLAGSRVDLNTGALLPVNLNGALPSVGHFGRAAMSYVLYTQFLTHHIAVVAGKLALTGSDPNEFAHGPGLHAKGDWQFMNIAYNFSPLTIFPAQYTPIGTGFLIIPGKDPDAFKLQAYVFSGTGDSTVPGFDKFTHDSLSWSVEGHVRTHFFGKTGHQTAGYVASNREFTSLYQLFSLSPEPVELQKVQGTWLVYYNFDQYLWEPEKGKGFGVFGRFGASDGNPDLIHYFYSVGVGGTGVGAKRPLDTYGIGTYYINTSHPVVTTPEGERIFLRDEKNLEAWYSFAITPWAFLSPDLQVVHGMAQQNLIAHIEQGVPLRNIDTAVVLGVRLRLVF
ncbi:MAG TPA: carbohydrate porin [Candidatus Sulfotelmatobacter sp.]|nr:carbohydrate porin [Candidatus Sulfotelmatobacter sp.]